MAFESKIEEPWAFAPGAKRLCFGDSESKIKEPWAFAPGAKRLCFGDSESKIKDLRFGDSERVVP
jgi:hypothetical protein